MRRNRVAPKSIAAPEAIGSFARSYPGMAHFAGTGPRNKLCKDCASYIGSDCAKYRAMTGQSPKRGIPPATPACKYFVKPELPL